MSDYSEKFKDPRWQKKRLKILERDNWKCQHCGEKEETLHIHHKYYLKGKEPWDYSNSALLVLCKTCHKDIQEQDSVNKIQVMQYLSELFNADEIADISYGLYQMQLLYHPRLIAYAYEYAFEDEDMQKMIVKKYVKDVKSGKAREHLFKNCYKAIDKYYTGDKK